MVTIDEPEIVRNGLARVLEELGRDHPRGQESGVRGQGLRVVIPGSVKYMRAEAAGCR
jgi:hypothetical protein